VNHQTFGLTFERHDGRDHVCEVPMIPGIWFVAILAFSVTLLGGMMMHAGLVIQAGNLAFAAIASSLLIPATIRYGVRNADTIAKTRLKDFSEHCLLMTAFILLGVIASYPIAAASSGFADAKLARADALLRFDWVSWYAFVARYPLLQQLGAAAYATIYISPVILLGYLARTGQRAAARQFLAAFWLAALLTLFLFPLMPAKGPLAFLWQGSIPYMPTSALYQAEIIPELRDHVFTMIDLGALRGLVCAPSAHSACAVLYIVSAWRFRPLRWVLIPVNIAMLLSIPVEGTHYLTDMLMGAMVALAATMLVKYASQLLVREPLNRTALTVSV